MIKNCWRQFQSRMPAAGLAVAVLCIGCDEKTPGAGSIVGPAVASNASAPHKGGGRPAAPPSAAEAKLASGPSADDRARLVDWPEAASAAAAALPPVAASQAQELAEASPVPVIALVRGAAQAVQVGGAYIRTDEGYSAAYQTRRHLVLITAFQPPFPPRPADTPTPVFREPPMAGMKDYSVSHTETGAVATFVRFNAGYAVTIDCRQPPRSGRSADCVSEADIGRTIHSLVVVRRDGE